MVEFVHSMENQYHGSTSCMIRVCSNSDSIQEKQSLVVVDNKEDALKRMLLSDVSNLYPFPPSAVRSNFSLYFAPGDTVSPIVPATTNKYNDKFSSKIATTIIIYLCLNYINHRRYVELPEDLWLQIFIRLPVKSLLLVMCVCKRWYVLIKDPIFRRAHLQFQKMVCRNSGERMLLNYNQGSWVINHILFDAKSIAKETMSSLPSSSCRNILPLSTSFEPGRFDIDGPINGLYCLYDCCGRTVIWNPATNEVGFLPSPEQCIAACFDWCERYLYFSIAGFGIDPLDEENYKVILFSTCISGCSDEEFACVMLYTTKTNTWRLLDADAFMVARPLNNTYLNGLYYWMKEPWNNTYCDGLYYGMEGNCTAFVFDMSEKESFRKISAPCHGELGLYNDYITMFSMNENLGELDIWVMLEENNNWFKKNCVRWIQEPVLKPLGFCESENEIFLLVGCGDHKTQIIRYNTITQEIRNFGPRGYNDMFKACIYYESFVSLSGGITKYKGNNYVSLIDMVGDFFEEEPEPF